MRALKVLSISLVVTAIAIFATKDIWNAKDIRLTFTAENSKDITYQAFYINTLDSKYNEQQSIKKHIATGIHNVEFILPTEKVVGLRLDFGSYPGTVLISDLKLIGGKTVNVLDDKEEQYWFSPDVTEHQFIDNHALRIVSNEADPYMVYKNRLNVTLINWSMLLQIILGTFFLAFLLSLLLTRKKTKKIEEKTKKIEEKTKKKQK